MGGYLRRIMVFVLLSVTAVSMVHAQETDYMFELGVGGGPSFYMGDVNSRLYANSNSMAGLVFRYNQNRRVAWKAGLNMGGLSGSSEGAFGVIPGDGVRFSRTVYDIDAQLEWGFCSYGMPSWIGSHRLQPYCLAGIGATFAPKPAKNDFAVNFPLGAGVRYKLAERVNVGLEWTMRFSSSDRLDVSGQGNGLEDPFLIKGKGMKNKDSYSFTMVYLTFDVFQRPCNCNSN